MSEPFLGEIRMFAGNFAIKGWATCDGQILSIAQNTALFALIGTFYGGNGQTTFALPNLQGSVPIHQGQGPGLSDRVIGESSGTNDVTLLTTEMPLHTHQANAFAVTSGSKSTNPTNRFWGSINGLNQFNSVSDPGQALSPAAIAIQGGGLPHSNQMPTLAVTFLIAMQGIFPARN